MENAFKNFKYLHCDSKYRVSKKSLAEVIQMTADSGLQPEQPQPKIILQGEKLNELLANNEMLISVCRPIMMRVFDSFTDKTKLLFLCDKKGFVIDIFSCTEVMHWSFSRGIMLGSCLDYYSFGTNSISMSIYEKEPVVIVGEEHYCNVLKTWSCIAAPVLVEGESVGYINISAEANSNLVQLIGLVELMAELTASYTQLLWKKCKALTEDSTIESAQFVAAGVDQVQFFGKVMVANINLTVKEVHILYNMYCGKSADIISKKLRITKNTLKTHMKNIYRKLGARNKRDCLQKINQILGREKKVTR